MKTARMNFNITVSDMEYELSNYLSDEFQEMLHLTQFLAHVLKNFDHDAFDPSCERTEVRNEFSPIVKIHFDYYPELYVAVYKRMGHNGMIILRFGCYRKAKGIPEACFETDILCKFKEPIKLLEYREYGMYKNGLYDEETTEAVEAIVRSLDIGISTFSYNSVEM